MARKVRYGKVSHPNGPNWGSSAVVVGNNRPKLSEEEKIKRNEKRTYSHRGRKKDKAATWYLNAKNTM